MDAAAPLIDGNLINSFIGSGHVWIALCLVILQAVILPLSIFFYKKFEANKIEKLELERAKTGAERNQRFSEIENDIKYKALEFKAAGDLKDQKISQLEAKVEKLFEYHNAGKRRTARKSESK